MPSDISDVTLNLMPAPNRAGRPTVLRTITPIAIAISIASIGWRAGSPIENGATGSWCTWYAAIAIAIDSPTPGTMDGRALIR